MNTTTNHEEPISSFAERLRFLRETQGYSRQSLYDALVKKYPDIPWVYATMTGWERGKYPRKNILSVLADFFGCSEDYLLGYAPLQLLKEQKLFEITVEDLEQYHGEPVMLSRFSETKGVLNDYALVNAKRKALLFVDGSVISFKKINEECKIYVRMSNTEHNGLYPLSLKAAKETKPVYIASLGTLVGEDPYAGYYYYNEHTHSFEKEDQTVILRDSAYNISYIAYANRMQEP